MENQENKPRRNAFIDAAMLAIKAEITAVTKGSANPFFKSTYADLNTCLKLVEPLVKKNGCYLSQPVIADQRTGKSLVQTKIVHAESGEMSDSSIFLSDIDDPQKRGSEITYYRRYTLKALLGMQDEDDDAEGTMSRQTKSKPASKRGDFL